MKKRLQVLTALGLMSLMVAMPVSYAEEEEETEIAALAAVEEEIVEEAAIEQTEAPQTEEPQDDTANDETVSEVQDVSETESEISVQESEATTETTETKNKKQQTEATTEATESVEETEIEVVEEEETAEEHESVDITDESEVAVNIVGFSVDPSAYPAADASENTKQVYKYLTEEMGLNHAGACGVLANMQMESGFSPLALGDGGTSYGLCQWHNERFNRLISYCNSVGQDYNTVEGQMAYLQYELESTFPTVLEYVKSVPDTQQGAYDAGYYWCVHFEAPANAEGNGALRGNLAANEYYPMDLSSSSEEESASSMIASIRADMSPQTDTDSAQDTQTTLEEQAQQALSAVLSIRDSLDVN